jgi:hypothetical protein
MAPKEKAIQLVELYWKSEHQPFNYEHSKRCALIAVDEILNTLFGTIYGYSLIEYWNEVKQEIEKL